MNKLTSIFKLLSDETRLRIILLLAQQELCVCQISGILDIAQPKVSKSLAKLRDNNIVQDRRTDKYIYYTLKSKNLVLMNILNNVLENIDQYDLLRNDSIGLKDKDKYLNQCNKVK